MSDIGTTFTTPQLIADVFTATNGSSDSLPTFTLVNGVPVSVALEIQSTTGTLLLPRMSTVERDNLNVYPGMQMYNLTTSEMQFYYGGAVDDWVNLASFSGATSPGDIAIFSNTSGTLVDSGVSLIFTDDGGGARNIFEGVFTGNNTLTGFGNIGYGISLFSDLGIASANTAVGQQIMNSLDDGQRNVGIGTEVLLNAIHGNDNIGIGVNVLSSLANSTGSRNVAIGSGTLADLDSLVNAFDNVALGYQSLFNANDSLRTTCAGSGSGGAQAAYTDCSLFGYHCDNSEPDLTGTCGFGSGASLSADYAAVFGFGTRASGIQSCAFGFNASVISDGGVAIGSNTTAASQDSVAIGMGAQTNALNAISIGSGSNTLGSNSVAIGTNAISNVDNGFILGPGGTLVGIGTSSPIANLHLNGTLAVKAPTVVPTGNFPYTVTATDCFVCCYPTGIQLITLPTVSNANLGRAFKISNASTGGLDQVLVVTASGQTVSTSSLTASLGGTFVAVNEGGTFMYRAAIGC